MRTPVTESGKKRYDDKDPVEAIVAAWTNPGPKPSWHREMQMELHSRMPLVARAIERLVADRRSRESNDM